ncbi:MAG: DUF116 domain-containing protein [Thermodesulfovibrionia bacterium]|nr:DUF116 domain-containing protein [Thermodesulfovibrionia bacterium]
MFKKEIGSSDKLKDRKLGDEWRDWDGETDSREKEINEDFTTFFILAAAISIVLIALFSVGWYMVKPRIDQFHPSASTLIQWSFLGFTVLFFMFVVIESIAVIKFRKSFLPYKLTEKFLFFLLPKTVWLGKKFGISRDRVGNSFIKTHNFMTKISAKKLHPGRLLVLLPRCLKKETRSHILNRLNGIAYKIHTVGGGEEARKAIRQCDPSFILAFACERDLMSGLKDVAEKIPVIAIPNKRPEGPCKNTHVLLEELEEVLEFIDDRKK